MLTTNNRLKKLFRSKRSLSDPICFDLDGRLLCNPQLLGKSKAGRLSWSANLDDTPVKIYECFSDAHAQFIEDVSLDLELSAHMPKCLHRVKNVLIVEWLQGKKVTWRQVQKNPDLLSRITKLQSVIHSRVLRTDRTAIGFDYLSFLKQRLRNYLGIVPMEPVFEKLETDLDAADPMLVQGLSHPDVTVGNLIFDATSGTLKLIDNELLGQNDYYLIDLFNTHRSFRNKRNSLTSSFLEGYMRQGGSLSSLIEKPQVYNAIWSIRLIGSSLQAGAINQAYQTAQRYIDGTLKPSPITLSVEEMLN